MKAIKRDIARNIDMILYSYDDITEYIMTNWGLGLRTASLIEDWYYRTH